ncbi:hypothetical protein GCM10028797_25770 [Dyella agri]
MNWKIVLLWVCAFGTLAALGDLHRRSKDHDAAELLQERSAPRPAESVRPMHNPPRERDIVALAEKDSFAFCHPVDQSADGCELDAALIGSEWTVFAWPYLGTPGKSYRCCAPDSARLFIYSRNGTLLRQERGGP